MQMKLMKLNKQFFQMVEDLRNTTSEYSEELENLHEQYEEAVNDASDAITRINETVEAFNDRMAEIRDEAEEQTADLVQFKDDLRSAWEDRSEKWQESEKGIAASAWIDEIEYALAPFEAVELHDELEIVDEPAADSWYGLNTDFDDLCEVLEGISEQPEE